MHATCRVAAAFHVGQHGVAGEPHCQDEMLKQLPLVAEQTEYSMLRAELLPWMHTLCLKTTMASVRVNALRCMAQVAARLDEEEAGNMLQTAAKVCTSHGQVLKSRCRSV